MKYRFILAILLVSVFVFASDLAVNVTDIGATGNNIERVSISEDGTQGNGSSYYQNTSFDGRYVVFASHASNLVPNDTNGFDDIFVRDLQLNTTTRVSIASDGTQGTYESQWPSISGDGRFVSFESQDRLDPDIENSGPSIFIRDQLTNITSVVSISDNGTPGYPHGGVFSSVSYDGRYVAFSSSAWNLVPNDTNNMPDIFVRDRQANTTSRVSIASDGTQGNGDSSWWPSISGDGRYVAFDSTSTNLVSNSTSNGYHVFVRDLGENTTIQVDLASNGTPGNSGSGISVSSISIDGRYIAFASSANNLVPKDKNGISDIFIRDRQANTTKLVSVASDGTQGNGGSSSCSISGDGRYVAFDSNATNLVPNDTNGKSDVFVRDRQKNITALVSCSSDGVQGNNASLYPTISSDGKHIAFFSDSSNLVPDDTNGFKDVFIVDNPLYRQAHGARSR